MVPLTYYLYLLDGFFTEKITKKPEIKKIQGKPVHTRHSKFPGPLKRRASDPEAKSPSK